jgi:hypothetical protein
VFHQAQLSEEGQVVADWLKERGISYWTVASAVDPAGAAALCEFRRQLHPDFRKSVHGEANPMMFFTMK